MVFITGLTLSFVLVDRKRQWIKAGRTECL